MAKKKANKNIPLPILIIICAVLLFAIYNSISTLALGLWGDTVMGTIDSYNSRLDNTTAQENRSRTVSKGYWFMANGKEYRGYVVYSSDESWPNLDEGETRSKRIRYLDVFPYVNKPAMLCEFDEMGEVAIIYHILAPIGCILLLLLVIRTGRRGKKKKKVARKPAASQIIEVRSDRDMFCPNCGNKLTDGAAFCSGCGAKTQTNVPGACTVCGATLPEGAEFCIGCGKAVPPAVPEAIQPSRVAASAPPQSSVGLVGFSDRCNSPEILACSMMNPIKNDRCKRCNNLLFK